MSDLYVSTSDETIESNPERNRPLPQVSLDGDFYKKIDDFASHFPHGVPSMLHCDGLTIKGDVAFGRGVVLRGMVRIENRGTGQARVPEGTVLEGDVILEGDATPRRARSEAHGEREMRDTPLQ